MSNNNITNNNFHQQSRNTNDNCDDNDDNNNNNNNGMVVGLAFGAFGEVSKTVPDLLRKVAKVAAARQWRKLGARSRDEAKAHLYQKYRRLVGILGVKAI